MLPTSHPMMGHISVVVENNALNANQENGLDFATGNTISTEEAVD